MHESLPSIDAKLGISNTKKPIPSEWPFLRYAGKLLFATDPPLIEATAARGLET